MIPVYANKASISFGDTRDEPVLIEFQMDAARVISSVGAVAIPAKLALEIREGLARVAQKHGEAEVEAVHERMAQQASDLAAAVERGRALARKEHDAHVDKLAKLLDMTRNERATFQADNKSFAIERGAMLELIDSFVRTLPQQQRRKWAKAKHQHEKQRLKSP